MNKITEKQEHAQQSFLGNQQAEMLVVYKNAGKSERTAIIRQIDSFLPVISGDEKTFWLSFRQKLERMDEQVLEVSI